MFIDKFRRRGEHKILLRLLRFPSSHRPRSLLVSSHFWQFSCVHWNSIYDSFLWCCSLVLSCVLFYLQKTSHRCTGAGCKLTVSRTWSAAEQHKTTFFKFSPTSSTNLIRNFCLRIPHLSEYFHCANVLSSSDIDSVIENLNQNLRYLFHHTTEQHPWSVSGR